MKRTALNDFTLPHTLQVNHTAMQQLRVTGGVESTMMRTATGWLFFLLFITTASAGAASTNALDLFTRAIQNESTAPNYVLITVVDDNTNKKRLLCTEAPFLLGAIHREREISYDAAGVNKVRQFALSCKARMFHFSRSDALKNVSERYDQKILVEMRSALRNLPDDQLRQGFQCDGKGLDKLYTDKPSRQYSAYRDAIAYVLLERGLLPRRGCVVGCLTVDE